MFRRVTFAGLVLVLELLPATAAFLVLRGVVLAETAEAAATSVATPNPSRPPAEFLGPLELLVFVEPWFAGTLVFWLAPWLAILLAYPLAAAALVRFSASSIPRRPVLLPAIALLLGAAFAIPWVYALCRVLAFT
jgi:hypothetical protein